MTLVVPAEAFPPGEYLADELEARGWSQSDFAEIIGRPVQFVSEIINGKKEMTAESAAQIGAALGSDPQTWLNLQSTYQLWQLRQRREAVDDAERLALRGKIAEVVPLAQLEKRGIPTEPAADLWEAVRRDFNMESADDEPAFGLAAKRSNVNAPLSLLQRGWLWCALRSARSRRVPPFDKRAFRRLVEGLSRQVQEPKDFEGLPEDFARVGVHLVFEEPLAGGKIDGAAFLADDAPVIALSGRGKRFDKVFFALMHECAHVLCGHAHQGVTVDEGGNGNLTDSREEEANRLAVELCFSRPISVTAPVTRVAVEREAIDLGVHPSLVVGHLQHRKIIPWRTTLASGIPAADEALRTWNA